MLMTHGGAKAKRFDWVFCNDFVKNNIRNGREEKDSKYSVADALTS